MLRNGFAIAMKGRMHHSRVSTCWHQDQGRVAGPRRPTSSIPQPFELQSRSPSSCRRPLRLLLNRGGIMTPASCPPHPPAKPRHHFKAFRSASVQAHDRRLRWARPADGAKTAGLDQAHCSANKMRSIDTTTAADPMANSWSMANACNRALTGAFKQTLLRSTSNDQYTWATSQVCCPQYTDGSDLGGSLHPRSAGLNAQMSPAAWRRSRSLR